MGKKDKDSICVVEEAKKILHITKLKGFPQFFSKIIVHEQSTIIPHGLAPLLATLRQMCPYE